VTSPPPDDTSTPADDKSPGAAAGVMEQPAPPGKAAGAKKGLDRFTPGNTLAKHALLMLLAFLGAALLIETVSDFRVSQLAAMAYYIPAVAGLTLLTGINGQISLGHGALMAIGGYTAALLLIHVEGIPFALVLIAAMVVTALAGILVGAAASRLHGPYLAGATLALAVGLPPIAIYFEHELGGEQGLRVPRPDPPGWIVDVHFFITGQDLTAGKYVAYVGWLTALLVLLFLSNLIRSRYGRMWRSVRDDEVAAQLSGVNLGRNRVLAFVVSAACAGAGGALLAIVARLVSPLSFTIVLSIFLLVAIVIGGLGSLTGAVLGSAILVFLIPFVTNAGLDAGLSSAQAANAAPLAFGIFLIVVMLAAPQGVVGTIRLKYLTRKAARAMREAGQG
jgi:branched-chain amino acid transport system permease protein